MAKKSEAPAVLGGDIPEWATPTAIGKLIGKSVRRVQQLTQEGILQTDQPESGGRRRYKTCETIRAYIAHVEKKAAEDNSDGRMAELKEKKLEAEVALKESQGNLHKLKTSIAEGKYIPAADAERELDEFLQTFKKFAMAMPSRMAGTAASFTDAITVRSMEKAMRKEMETMLTTYVDAMRIEERTCDNIP